MARLVELLVDELQEWPGGFETIQQRGNDLYFYEADGSYTRGIGDFPLATDHVTAIVTREMWEAERRKLAAPKQWRGEGLPPIGAKGCTSGGKCEVLGVDDINRQIFIRWRDGETGVVPVHVFRPIDTRTPRDKWIESAIASLNMDYSVQSETGTTTQEYVENAVIQIYDTMIAKLPEDGE